MNKIKSSLIIIGLFSVNAFAEDKIIFPQEQKKCAEIVTACSFDSEKKCQKTLCGYDINNAILKDFVASNRLIGRKFESLLDMEAFLKNKIPKELKKYKITFKTDDALSFGYESAILFTITQKNVITKVELY